MITEAILNGFQAVVQILLFLLPNLPAMPSGIQSAMQMIVDLIGNTVGVISYIYTPIVLIFIFTFILAILGFDFIYKFVLWVLHKIRG